MAVANTFAYYDARTMMPVKSVVVQTTCFPDFKLTVDITGGQLPGKRVDV
jgi:hypothetical protein